MGATIFLLLALNTALNNKQKIHSQGITEITKVQANTPEKKYDLNVLFIGNSYTFFNYMPNMVLKIAQNDPNNAYNIAMRSITFGGARLQDHWNNQKTHVMLFSQKAKQDKSYIMIYQTWPRQRHTAKVASENGAGTAPVGEYWYKILNTYPEINLYENDGTHPSMAGSYLAALVFYKYLTGNSPMDTAYIPRGVPKKPRRNLKTHNVGEIIE